LKLRKTVNPLSAQSKRFQPGDSVQVLQPDYVAGAMGIICDQEVLSDGRTTDRWLIRVEPGNIIVSLLPDEFILIPPEDEP
jgi:hypothetical protein